MPSRKEKNSHYKQSCSITIITPVWNALPFLQELTDSVLGQKYQSWEWILSDNGSSDGSRDFLLDLQARGDERIHVFLQESNLGIFGNLNFLCQQASSELISILCADDFFASPDSIELILSEWRQLDSSVGAISWCARVLGKVGMCSLVTPEKSQLLFFLHANFLGNLTEVSFRKSAWEAVGPFDQRYPAAGDFYYWTLFAQHFTIAIVHANPVFVRKHSGSANFYLNQAGEASAQYAEITSAVYSRVSPKGGLPRFSLRAAGTLVHDFRFRTRAIKYAILGNPHFYQALAKSSRHKQYLLSPFLRWILFILFAGGKLGNQFVLSAAWRLNRKVD